jgi:hypothetical protein
MSFYISGAQMQPGHGGNRAGKQIKAIVCFGDNNAIVLEQLRHNGTRLASKTTLRALDLEQIPKDGGCVAVSLLPSLSHPVACGIIRSRP